MRKEVEEEEDTVRRESGNVEARAQEGSCEDAAGQEQEATRRRVNQAEEDEEEERGEDCRGVSDGRDQGVESEGTTEEVGGGEKHEVATLFSPTYLYEDAYIGSQNDWYAVDSFFDDWVEDGSTQSYCVSTLGHDGQDGGANEEREERDGYSGSRKKDGDTASAQTPGDKGRRDENAAVTVTTPTPRDTHEDSYMQRGHVHKQQQQEGDGEEHGQQELRQQLLEGSTQQDAEATVGAQENKTAEGTRREKQQRSRLQQKEKQCRKEEARLKRLQQKLEERRQREVQREYERKEKMQTQQRDQQIRIYFAGVEAAVVLALKEQLEQPQFLPLRELLVVFNNVPRQQQSRHEIQATDTLFCTLQATLEIVHGSRSQIAIPSVLLDEEVAAVSALTRLCPTALCVVRMPHPIQNYLQQLQLQMLQTQHLPTQQNVSAQQQSEQLFVRPDVCIQGITVAEQGSDDVKQQSLQICFSCSRRCDRERSNSYCSTSENEADTGSSSGEKSNPLLWLYAHMLVLPLFTETTCLGSPLILFHCLPSSSHISKGSSTPYSVTKQRSEHVPVEDICTMCRPTCPHPLNSDSDCSTVGGCASGSCLNAPCGRSNHRSPCGKGATTDNRLSEKLGNRPAFESLAQQLRNLLGELRGAGRVVCIFQGVRASLAVPQPRVEDEGNVEKASRDSMSSCCLSLSQHGHIDNRCCRSHCIPASGEVICSSASPSPAYLGFDCSSPTQYASAAEQENAQIDKTAAGQGSNGKNMGDPASAGACKSTSCASQRGVAGSTSGETECRSGRIHPSDPGGSQKTGCLRATETPYAERRPISSPGELDEIIATILVDCGVDCVEPPDATSTADYILTAVKHIRAAQRTVGEQSLRVKKSKTFTAAEEAIFAEVAQAATSTTADHTLRPPEHVSPATTQRLSLRCSRATPGVIPAACKAATGAHVTSDITPVVHPTEVGPSGAASLAGAASEGTSTENVVGQREPQSSAVDRSERRREDVFTEYEDVSLFACRLWGKQLVQIPTVTDKVAAAVMRQYKRPAALLQEIRVAEAYKVRAGAEVSPEEAASANASRISGNHSIGRGDRAHAAASDCERRAPRCLLAHSELHPIRNARKKMNKDAHCRAGKRHHTVGEKKQMDQGLVGKLAEIVLHGISANPPQATSAGTEEDFGDVDACVQRWRADGKVAKIGTARARKIYLLFSQNAAGTP